MTTTRMDEIIPGLWLGDIFASRDTETLQSHSITHILSIARGSIVLLTSKLIQQDNESLEKKIKHMRIELDDDVDGDLLGSMESGVGFINDALVLREEGTGGILVHCMQGLSRSCSFVMGYLIWKDGLTVGEAHRIVQEKRRQARPNSGFWRQLGEWERVCREKEKKVKENGEEAEVSGGYDYMATQSLLDFGSRGRL